MSVTTAVAQRPRRSWLQGIPWLWTDYVARKALPSWLLALFVFFLMYGLAASVAIAAGDLPRFLRDARWLSTNAVPAFASLGLGYITPAMNRLQDGLRPWLTNEEREVAALQNKVPNLLMRFFWIGALIWGAYLLQFFVYGRRGVGSRTTSGPTSCE